MDEVERRKPSQPLRINKPYIYYIYVRRVWCGLGLRRRDRPLRPFAILFP